MKDNMTLPSELRSAVTAIKQAILQSQYRAAKAVNREQLSLYYGIGRYISEHSREGYWGTGAIDSISEQLQRELPGLRGFSGTSIKKMRQFYEEWNSVIRPPMAVESSAITNRPPSAVDLAQPGVSLSRVSEAEVIDTSLLTTYRQPMAAELMIEEFVSMWRKLAHETRSMWMSAK